MDRKFSELDNLKMVQAKWYKSLPKQGVDFATAILTAKKYKISKTTAHRRISDPVLFKKVGKMYIPIIE
jgi:hypothetical protein